MREMSPKERWYWAFMHKEPDQVPITILTAEQTFTEFSGLTFHECYFNIEKYLKAQLDFVKRFGKDAYILPAGYITHVATGLFPIASAFGCKIQFVEDQPGRPIPVLKSPDEIPDFVKKVQPPNLRKDGYCPEVLKQLRYLEKHVPEEVVQSQWSYKNTSYTQGVGDLAFFIMGPQAFLVGMKLYPSEVHRFLDILEENQKEWLEIQEEIVGPIKWLLLAEHTNGFMSKKYFLEFVLPHDRAIIRSCPGAVVIHHSESDVTNAPDVQAEMVKYIDGYHMCPQMDIGIAKSLYGDKCTLIGNVDTVEVMTQGTPKDVDAAVKDIIAKAAPGGGFALSAAGGLFVSGRWENIDAYIAAGKKYGKYPIELTT